MRTPLGEVLLVTDEHGVLRALDFHDYEARMQRLLSIHYGDRTIHPAKAPAALIESMTNYFDGDLQALKRIQWSTAGTEFQRLVWRSLTAIDAGTTQSYGALAARLGKANASRAVGLANGSNPISIVVPCHRLIAANGALTGYAGGLHRKEWLLRHEGAR